MALTHTTATRNAIADAVVDLIDVGVTGEIIIATAGFGLVLATIVMDDPAFGAAASGIATMLAPPKSDTSADATGTAAVFKITDGNGLEVFQGDVTVTGGGGDMELTTLALVVTEQVNITAFTYTAPA